MLLNPSDRGKIPRARHGHEHIPINMQEGRQRDAYLRILELQRVASHDCRKSNGEADAEAPPAGTSAPIDRGRRAGVAVGTSEEDKRFHWERDGILPEVVVDLAGPLGD